MRRDATGGDSAARPDPATEDAKWDAYAETVLEFPGPPLVTVDLRLPLAPPTRRALRETVGAERFAVFTAENPAGENAEDAASGREESRRERRNEDRRGELAAELLFWFDGDRFWVLPGIARREPRPLPQQA
jgi:hypothetical protein